MAGMRDPLFIGDDPVLMGIINVTPDSFSDGGEFLDARKAIEHGLKLYAEGAHILDIGGESTRPGSAPVTAEEEQARILPVIDGLKNCGAMLSVDTRNAATMRAAIVAGAHMINDISALRYDPESMDVVAAAGIPVCLMHMQGDPKTMQDAPVYKDVFAEVYGYLEERISLCIKAGIARDKIMIDPGIGFGKTLNHNLTLLNRLDEFRALDVPVLLGASRKRFIGEIDPSAVKGQRLAGSLAVCIDAYRKGIRHFRVHDVAETAQALAVVRAIKSS